MIVNLLGVSRFWHVAKIVAPPYWVCDRVCRLVWSFVWKGKMENVSRQRCCAPPDLGGLGVVDFRSKCVSLRLSCLSSLHDNFGTQKWHYLARYFIGNRLANLDARFSFFSINAPVSFEPSAFYSKCLSHLKKIVDTHGALPDDFSCKSIYSLLFDLPRASPKSAVFWGSVVGRPIFRWASVWRKSRLKLIENHKNDLLWLILHNAIRVRYNLKSWGYINSDQCAVCSRVESTKHCFVRCPRVARAWNSFTPFLSRLLGSPFLPSFSSVFFPLVDPLSSPGLPVFRYLLATILFCIWQARNLATFRNKVLTSRAIVDMIIKDLKLRIRCDPIDRVQYLWSMNGIICQADANNKITFNF